MDCFFIKAPISVELAITHKCNHKCIHCYNPDRPYFEPVSIDDWNDKANIIIKEFINNGIKKVVLTGGEPTLCLKQLRYFLEKFDKTDIVCSLNTNATQLTDDFLKFLKNLNKVPFVFVSLPSTDKETCDLITRVPGSYDHIMQGLDLLSKHKIETGINIVASKINNYEYKSIQKLLDEHENIQHVSITPVLPPSYDENNEVFYLDESDYQNIIKVLKHISQNNKNVSVGSASPLPVCLTGYDNFIRDHTSMCSAARTNCAVNFENGNIMACPQYDKSYGNIYTDGLLAGWNNMDEWRRTDIVSEECANCHHLSFCGGECRNYKNLNKKYKLNNKIKIEYDSCLTKYNPDIKYRVNEKLQFRKENKGYTVFVDNNRYVFIKETMYKFINILIKLDVFNKSDLEEYVIFNDNFIKNMNKLVQCKIIIPID